MEDGHEHLDLGQVVRAASVLGLREGDDRDLAVVSSPAAVAVLAALSTLAVLAALSALSVLSILAALSALSVLSVLAALSVRRHSSSLYVS
ncbi:hypothetical protein [Streptomyces sp. NPDC047981]|uniref:hypothetical protein n=1 Tax=Streptomyces sp. NPDC047981 TaxID=3154610 RepID=UPI003417BB02